MAMRRFVRKAEDWAEVARWLGIFWPCRCQYSNAASYRCYYCGSRAPAKVRTLVADTLRAADAAVAKAAVPAAVASKPAGPPDLAGHPELVAPSRSGAMQPASG